MTAAAAKTVASAECLGLGFGSAALGTKLCGFWLQGSLCSPHPYFPVWCRDHLREHPLGYVLKRIFLGSVPDSANNLWG